MLALIAPDFLFPMTQNTERCVLWAVQVEGTQLHQNLASEAAADVNVTHCTQIPFTQDQPGLKRLRKQVQLKDVALGGTPTPKPQRRSKAKKLLTADGGLADLTLQTPMPETGVGSEFGPPPPDSTPVPQRMDSYLVLATRLSSLCWLW